MEALKAENISKRFCLYHEPPLTVQKIACNLLHRKQFYHELWVLREINLSLSKGEALGLVGANGSGKTTLLRVLAGIYAATSGQIWYQGRMAAFLELGLGFLLEFTGLENLCLHGAVFGLSRRQIMERIPRIIEFSRLDGFLDVPLRQYSFGMRMRLAFALMVNIEPDIMLIDESLAVGDISFRQRCFAKIEELKSRGAAFILVSHVMEEVARLCDRVLWIDEGRIRSCGDAEKVLKEFSRDMKAK